MKKLSAISFIIVLLLGTILPQTAFAFTSESNITPQSDENDSAVGQETSNESETLDQTKEEIHTPEIEETKTEKLAEIKTAKVQLWETDGDEISKEKVSKDLLDQSFFVINKTTYEDTTYYQLLEDKEDVETEIGWVKKKDLKTFDYEEKKEPTKTSFFTGKGQAYENHAWSGSENESTIELSTLEDESFDVKDTVTVGDITWHGGLVEDSDDPIWIEEQFLTDEKPIKKEESKDNSVVVEKNDVSKSTDEANKDKEKSNEVEAVEEDEKSESTEESEADDSSKEATEEDKTETEDSASNEEDSKTEESDENKEKSSKEKEAIEEDEKSDSNDDDSTEVKADENSNKSEEVDEKESTEVDESSKEATEEDKTETEDLDEANEDKEKSTETDEGTIKEKEAVEENEKPDSTDKDSTVAKEDKHSEEPVEVDEKESTETDEAKDPEKENPKAQQPSMARTFSLERSATPRAVKPVESKTSRLGHIKNSSAPIYKTIGDNNSKISSTKYMNSVYYIKKQAKLGKDTYYLLSTQPSSTSGTIGWIKSSDVTTHAHKAANNKKFTAFFKGKGVAYNRGWGGSKNLVYKSLKSYKGQAFNVHKTETIGSNTWYRGDFKGKQVWIHSSHVTKNYATSENKTSKLGKIKNASVKIYKTLGNTSTSYKAGNENNRQVFYIKQQAIGLDGKTYYLIRNSLNTNNAIKGWVVSTDVTTHAHKSHDNKKRSFKFKGKGVSYNRAWGGIDNRIYSSLAAYKGKTFKVHKTEKVDNNTWYRGTFNGKTMWIHSNHLIAIKQTSAKKKVTRSYVNHNATLKKMTDIQLKAGAQTDRYHLWIHSDGVEKISGGYGTIDGNWNLRKGIGTGFPVSGSAKNGDRLPIKGKAYAPNGALWYHVKDITAGGWKNATRGEVDYYMNSANFLGSLQDQLQFADLGSTSGINTSEVNKNILAGKGVLAGKAPAFVKAGRTHGVNEIYLISHALLESGNGTSKLAKGVKYKGVTVYNMYGIGAIDSDPLNGGAKTAYEKGWTTVDKAIIGGAKFVGQKYVHSSYKQRTLFDMRWNPASAIKNGYATHQYATDVGWAKKQTSTMNRLYTLIDSYNIKLRIPRFK